MVDNDHAMTKSKVLKRGRKENCTERTLDFRKANVNKLRDLVDRIPTEANHRERSSGQLTVF